MIIDILGSCVTRDAFRFNDEMKIGRYYARTSLVSLYSEPINIKLEEINLPSKFLQRMVFFDLTKDFRNYMKNTSSKVLIIDFIDDRFQIIKCGTSYITFSNEFNKSNLLAKLKGNKVPSETKKKLWKKAAKKFIKDVNKYYDLVILHKAYWQSTYIGVDGTQHTFENKPINAKNEELNFFYDVIERKAKNIKTIKIDGMLASAAHKWGLTPYHYEDEYYIQFNHQLKNILDHI